LYKDKMTEKPPSNAELIEWIKVLEVEDFFEGEINFNDLTESQKIIIKYTLPIIAKSKDDTEKIASL
jgi:hypothetical protein